MSDSSQIQTIETRQREIADELMRLQKEADELAIAVRVLRRFADDATKAEPSTLNGSEQYTRRPSGTPTNFDMVELVLATSEKEGKDGLTANEIVQEIGRRYWPGLIGKQILPSIYQFAKKGRLRKTSSGKFKRVRKSESNEKGSTVGAVEPS